MNYPVFPIGHDFGNSETNQLMFVDGMRVERRTPSIASIGSWKKVVASAKGSGQRVEDIVASNHYILEYDNQEGRRVEKFIGQKVYDDGAKPMETHGDSSRYWTNNYNLEMLMVGAASMVGSPTEFGLHVVTGMPIQVYLDDPNNAEYVKKALSGTHNFVLNGIERTMHVLSVTVIMEGAGALIAHGDKSDTLQGVIDIGGRTTDLYVARGQKPRAANSKGFSLGVGAAAERFAEKFRENYGYTLSAEARMELLKQHVSGLPYRTVKDKSGVRILDSQLRLLLTSALREIGQEIATTVVATWDEILMEFGTILIVGGGAHYFAEDIESRINGAHRPHKPEMANAAGYAGLANAIHQRARMQQQRSA